MYLFWKHELTYCAYLMCQNQLKCYISNTFISRCKSEVEWTLIYYACNAEDLFCFCTNCISLLFFVKVHQPYYLQTYKFWRLNIIERGSITSLIFWHLSLSKVFFVYLQNVLFLGIGAEITKESMLYVRTCHKKLDRRNCFLNNTLVFYWEEK